MSSAVVQASLVSILPHQVINAPLVEWASLPHEERTFELALALRGVSRKALTSGSPLAGLLSMPMPRHLFWGILRHILDRLELLLAHLDVAKESRARSVIKRHSPALASLPFSDPHSSLPLRYLNVLQPEVGQLGNSKACAEQRLDHSQVPY